MAFDKVESFSRNASRQPQNSCEISGGSTAQLWAFTTDFTAPSSSSGLCRPIHHARSLKTSWHSWHWSTRKLSYRFQLLLLHLRIADAPWLKILEPSDEVTYDNPNLVRAIKLQPKRQANANLVDLSRAWTSWADKTACDGRSHFMSFQSCLLNRGITDKSQIIDSLALIKYLIVDSCIK